ncbi:conserved hypothetical protein [Trichinella spiralis]|uniref:hypothetical protein n=1 Tax=Trichinella spiralis TaxID=6334 RepID=UPI0001EFE4F0|nr:conserved hypothetical protein [Trichinella spiralis]
MNDKKSDTEIASLCSVNFTIGILVVVINTIPFSMLLVMKKFNSEISLVFGSLDVSFLSNYTNDRRCAVFDSWCSMQYNQQVVLRTVGIYRGMFDDKLRNLFALVLPFGSRLHNDSYHSQLHSALLDAESSSKIGKMEFFSNFNFNIDHPERALCNCNLFVRLDEWKWWWW